MTCFTSPFADASWHELSAALAAGTWATPPVAARAEAAMAATATRTAMRRTGIERMEAISYSPVSSGNRDRARGKGAGSATGDRGTEPDCTGPHWTANDSASFEEREFAHRGCPTEARARRKTEREGKERLWGSGEPDPPESLPHDVAGLLVRRVVVERCPVVRHLLRAVCSCERRQLAFHTRAGGHLLA